MKSLALAAGVVATALDLVALLAAMVVVISKLVLAVVARRHRHSKRLTCMRRKLNLLYAQIAKAMVLIREVMGFMFFALIATVVG